MRLPESGFALPLASGAPISLTRTIRRAGRPQVSVQPSPPVDPSRFNLANVWKESNMTEVLVYTRENGPIVITGPIRMIDHQGNPFDLAGKENVALCRCTHSARRPFCDGSHKKHDFRAAVTASSVTASQSSATGPSAVLSSSAGPSSALPGAVIPSATAPAAPASPTPDSNSQHSSES